jgi:hypothetical protein
MVDTKRRRGRPPKPPDQRRPHTLAIRVNDELYQRLRRETEATGRSLSEEAEVLFYGAFEARARAHETLIGMLARGEVVLQPRSSPWNASEAAPAAAAPSISGLGSLAEIAFGAGLTGGLRSGELPEAIKSELFGGMFEVFASALNAVAANAREATIAAVRETLPAVVRDELAAMLHQPKGDAGSSKNPADAADSTPA